MLGIDSISGSNQTAEMCVAALNRTTTGCHTWLLRTARVIGMGPSEHVIEAEAPVGTHRRFNVCLMTPVQNCFTSAQCVKTLVSTTLTLTADEAALGLPCSGRSGEAEVDGLGTESVQRSIGFVTSVVEAVVRDLHHRSPRIRPVVY